MHWIFTQADPSRVRTPLQLADLQRPDFNSHCSQSSSSNRLTGRSSPEYSSSSSSVDAASATVNFKVANFYNATCKRGSTSSSRLTNTAAL